MVQHTVMEMIILKEEVYTHWSLETGGMACSAGGPHREDESWLGDSGKEDKPGLQPLLSFPGEKQGKTG